MKQIKIITILLLLLIPVGFSTTQSFEDLKVDNTDYKIERSLWDMIFSPLSAYVDGSIISEPDKVDQYEINSVTTSLYYPVFSKDSYIIFEFLRKSEDCTSDTQYQGPVQLGDDAEHFYCTGESVEVKLLDKEKVFVSRGKDKDGNSKINLPTGTTHVKREVHYIREDAIQSTTLTKDEEDTYEELNDEDAVSQTDIDDDDNEYLDNEGAQESQDVTVTEEVENVYYNKFFCKGSDMYQAIKQNGEESSRLYKECSSCETIDENSVQCGEMIQNGDGKKTDTTDNDTVSLTSLLLGFGLAGSGYLGYKKIGGKKRK